MRLNPCSIKSPENSTRLRRAHFPPALAKAAAFAISSTQISSRSKQEYTGFTCKEIYFIDDRVITAGFRRYISTNCRSPSFSARFRQAHQYWQSPDPSARVAPLHRHPVYEAPMPKKSPAVSKHADRQRNHNRKSGKRSFTFIVFVY